MPEEKMKYYDALRQPPPEALKQIQGGRIGGKTDINPQWRYKAVTEQFGPCGVGWKYNIEKLWLEPAEGEVCAFAQISLFIKVDGEWSEAIPGVGGSMLVAKESKGPYVSDEAYKMAITDALSVAMKMIGVAADIYAGLWDGTKYKDQPVSTAKKPSENKPPDNRDHFCKQHGVKYFKTEKMKSYAHPIEGTNEWCYEHTKKDTSVEEKQPIEEKPPATNIPPLKNLGELYTRAGKYGLSPRDVCQACGVGAGKELTDWDEAWRTTAKKFEAQIRAIIDKSR